MNTKKPTHFQKTQKTAPIIPVAGDISAAPLEVLYEDNHLIAVVKPPGVLVQGDDSGGRSGAVTLMDDVKAFLKKKYNKPGNVFLGLIHRLDRPVGGIVLFAKTSKGAARLSEQFREHTTDKIYYVWVLGNVKGEKNTILVNYLIKDELRRKADIYDEPLRNAQRAELQYTVIDYKAPVSLVKINLKTGRFHQIRVQMAHIGHPIVGDTKYGSTNMSAEDAQLLKRMNLPDGAIALWATSLTFETATTGETKTVSIPVPKLS